MPTVRVRPRHPVTGSPMIGERVTVRYTQIVFGSDMSTVARSSYLNTNATGYADFLLDSSADTNPVNAQVTFTWNGVSGLLATVPDSEGPHTDGTLHWWELEEVIDGGQMAPVAVTAGVQSVTGTGVNNTDPRNPVVTGGGGGSSLSPTAVKTANYTAVASDLVPVDTTSGNVAITLPTAPADKAQVGVKHIIRGGTNTVTINCGGSDVFNKTGGGTSLTLTLLNQATIVQYKASTGIWYVVSDDLSLAQLDLRYDAAGLAAAAQAAAIAAADSYTDGKITAEVTRANGAYDAAGAAAAEATARANADALLIPLAQKAAANGVATLDGSSKVPASQMPSLRLVNAATVANQAARLALPTDDDAQFVVQSDTAVAYVLPAGANPSVNGNWIVLPQPSTAGLEQTVHKDAAGGYAGLDGSGLLNVAEVPASIARVETVTTVAASGASQTVVVPASGVLTVVMTLTANCAVTVDASGVAAGKMVLVTIEFVQDATGGRSWSFASPVVWPGNNATPTGTTTALHRDIVSLSSTDRGATFQGALSGSDYPALALPVAPTLGGSAGNTQTFLSWTAVSAVPNVTTYNLYRGTASGAEVFVASLGNVLTYTDTGRTNGTTYYYKLSAVNALGEGPLSAEIFATPSASLPTVGSAPIYRYAADMIASPPVTGSGLASWDDQSSGAHPLLQATSGKQPTYNTGVVNGKPAVHFTAANLCSMAAASVDTSPETKTIFAVMRVPTIAVTVPAATTTNTNAGLEIAIDASGFLLAVRQGLGTISSGGSVNALTANAWAVVEVSIGTGTPAHTVILMVNGNAQTVTSGTQNSFAAGSVTTSGLTIGGDVANGINYNTYDLAEQICYGTTLSTADRSTIRQYLGSKYGITVTP